MGRESVEELRPVERFELAGVVFVPVPRGQRWDGTPCAGSPDPRRVVAAAQVDPAGAGRFVDRLRANNNGYAPTVADLQAPGELGVRNAVLATLAAMGGIDCVNAGDPGQGTAFRAWVDGATPGWQEPEDGGVEDWVTRIYVTARDEGPDSGRKFLEWVATQVYGSLPDSYRKALERGIRDHYTAQLPGVGGGAVAALAVGGVVVFALVQARRRAT